MLNLRKTLTLPRSDPMESNFCKTYVKLLAFDLNALTLTRTTSKSDPFNFHRNSLRITRAETLGTVVSHDHVHGKFIKFTIDDGTGCVNCILWLNHLTSKYFHRMSESSVRLMADVALGFAEKVKLGVVARVRGRLNCYNGIVQINVVDVVIERDPNAEMLHWLDCVRVARKCYDVVPARSVRD